MGPQWILILAILVGFDINQQDQNLENSWWKFGGALHLEDKVNLLRRSIDRYPLCEATNHNVCDQFLKAKFANLQYPIPHVLLLQ